MYHNSVNNAFDIGSYLGIMTSIATLISYIHATVY